MKSTTIPNNFMKKSVRTIVTIGILAGTFFGYGFYQEQMDRKNYVEPYCAAKHSHNVEEYKACKVLSPVKVLQNLKETANVVSEVVDLPTL